MPGVVPTDRRWYVNNNSSSSNMPPPSSSRQKESSSTEDVATVFVRVRGDLPERTGSNERYPNSRGGSERETLPEDGCLEVLDERTIRCVTSHAGVAASMGGGTGNQYRFDGVLTPSSSSSNGFDSEQEIVYEQFARRAVKSFLSGSSSMVLAYGQTGSGKTHTMTGPPGLCTEHPGVIPRALEEIFCTASTALEEGRVRFLCAYIEVYNDKIFDLLRPERTPQNGFDIRDDSTYGVVVQGLKWVKVECVEEALDTWECGHQNLRVDANCINETSSRAHAIFTLMMEEIIEEQSYYGNDEEESCFIGGRVCRLDLVDLAGSEKWPRGTKVSATRKSEINGINQSLSCLGQCIAALSEPKRSHIPYRDCKLTRYLRPALDPRLRSHGSEPGAVVLIVCVSPDFADETSRSLQFADRAKKAIVYQQPPPPSQPKSSTKELAAKLQELYDVVIAQGGRVDQIEQMTLLAQQVGGSSSSNGLERQQSSSSIRSSNVSTSHLQLSVNKIQELEQRREELQEELEHQVSSMKNSRINPDVLADDMARIREQDKVLRNEISKTQSSMLVACQRPESVEPSLSSLPSGANPEAPDVVQIARRLWDRWGDKVKPRNRSEVQNRTPNKSYDVN